MAKNEDLVGKSYTTNGIEHRVIGEDAEFPDVVLTETLDGELGAQNADVVRVLLRQQDTKAAE